jgi:hypothetical protein
MLAARLSKSGAKPLPEYNPPRPIRSGPLTVEGVTQASGEFDTVWNNLKGDYPNLVIRNRDWVQWRYLDAPEQDYTVQLASTDGQPAGYIAYRVVPIGNRLIGRIADIFAAADDRTTQDALIKAANRHLARLGADSAATLVAVGSPAYSVFRRNLFLLSRGEYKVSFITPSSDVTLEQLSNPADWHLMGGDFDVV